MKNQYLNFYDFFSFQLEKLARRPKIKFLIKMIIHPHFIHLVKSFLYKRQLHYIRKKFDLKMVLSNELPIIEGEVFSKKIKSIKIEGPFWGSYSLSISNRAMAKVYLDKGYDVGTANIDGDGTLQPLDHQSIQDYSFLARTILRSETLDFPDLSLGQQYPPVTKQMRGKVRAYHAYGWEESVFPKKFARNFNRDLDFISVASSYVAKTLRDNGVTIPIISPGLGLSPMPVGVPDPSLQRNLRGKVFLHISSALLRKGIDVLLDAYGKAFSNSDDVTLLIKTIPTIHNNVEVQLREHQKNNPRYPYVYFINEDWPAEKISNLYEIADWAVFPTRGEGFGLPIADAMAKRVPVITTAYGGQVDFCKPNTALLCNYSFAYSRSHVATGESIWVEPDVEHLATLLKQAFLMDERERISLVEKAYNEIKDATWEGVAGKILSAADAIEDYCSRKNNVSSLSVAWISPWNARCGIATYSQNLSKSFLNRDLVVLARKESETIAHDEKFVHRIWSQDKAGLKSLIEFLRNHKTDAIIVQHNTGLFGLDWLLNLLLFSKEKKIDSYIFLHNVKEITGGSKEVIKDLNIVLKVATRTFVHSLSDLNLLRPFGEINNITLFPHGVYAPHNNDKKQLKGIEKLHLDGKKILSSFGFVLPHKGLRELIDAFRILRADDSSLHLLLINALHSSPESLTELKILQSRIEKYKLQDDITLISDFLDESESYSYLEKSELIIFPYQWSNESSSGAVKFGISCGRPVAVSPLALFEDIPESVAFRLPDKTTDGIVKGVKFLLKHRDITEGLISSARSYQANRSWEILSNRLYAIVEGCHNQRIFEEGLHSLS